MDELLKPNSYKSKREKAASTENDKKVSSVVSSPAKFKKKSGLSQVKNALISDEAGSVKNYVIMDVLIPAIKKAVYDIVANGLSILLYGETGSESRRRSSPITRISYSNCYDRPETRRRPDGYRQSSYTYDDIVYDSEEQAEAALSGMQDMIDRYGVVSIADLIDLSGLTTDNYTDNNYGWTSVASATIINVREGYIIKLPKARPIKK